LTAATLVGPPFAAGVSCTGKRNRQFSDIVPRIALRCGVPGGEWLPPSRSTLLGSAVEGESVLLPLGSPLPDDAVSALRGESGMLGGLSVPLSWGTAVPPDDYDPWAPEPEEGADADVRAAEDANPEAAAADNEWDEWGEWGEWEAEAEPRFDVPRSSSSVIPHSPAAG
jgi:hypothetical protein